MASSTRIHESEPVACHHRSMDMPSTALRPTTIWTTLLPLPGVFSPAESEAIDETPEVYHLLDEPGAEDVLLSKLQHLLEEQSFSSSPSSECDEEEEEDFVFDCWENGVHMTQASKEEEVVYDTWEDGALCLSHGSDYLKIDELVEESDDEGVELTRGVDYW